MKNDNKTRSMEQSEDHYLRRESERLRNIERSIYEDRRIDLPPDVGVTRDATHEESVALERLKLNLLYKNGN